MHINGCFLDVVADSNSPNGFSVREVSRAKKVVTKIDGKETLTDTKVSRGPFKSIYGAQIYAMSWSDIDDPPTVPDPEPEDPMNKKPDQVPMELPSGEEVSPAGPPEESSIITT